MSRRGTSELRALLFAPLAATSAFLAFPAAFVVFVGVARGDSGFTVALVAMLALGCGLLALSAAVVATLLLFVLGRLVRVPLASLALPQLLAVGAATGFALVVLGRSLTDDVSWMHLTLALPAGLVGGLVYDRALRGRQLTAVGADGRLV